MVCPASPAHAALRQHRGGGRPRLDLSFLQSLRFDIDDIINGDELISVISFTSSDDDDDDEDELLSRISFSGSDSDGRLVNSTAGLVSITGCS